MELKLALLAPAEDVAPAGSVVGRLSAILQQIDLVLMQWRQLIADSGLLVVGLVIGVIARFEHVDAGVVVALAVVELAAQVEAATELCLVAIVIALGQSAKI